uniref:Molybdenum cofactor sulfurase n=1 Tax=Kalanchoe fedtschenkoi TaxID=63787 RepID=A0A7N0TN87_KALFE
MPGDTDEAAPLLASSPKVSPLNSRPTSMVMKRAKSLIPAHLVAEAMSSLNGVDLRWSGPITPTEMHYVEQYVLTKYPQYCNGLLIQDETFNLSVDPPSPENTTTTTTESGSPSPPSSISHLLADIDKAQLLPSRLLETLTRKSTFSGNFVSIPEIQAQNRALRNCGLTGDHYAVLFVPNLLSAMTMIGESYPFYKGNCYLTILREEVDCIRDLALAKESKVIVAPESWMDLRIRGSQLSQYFRKKCKYSPKGLFCYPVEVGGVRYSMHWVSEARRNAWHVLLDATAVDFAAERMNLALHRPDFVVCAVEDFGAERAKKITCLLVRRKLF